MKLTSVSINPAGALVVASVSCEFTSVPDAMAFVNSIHAQASGKASVSTAASAATPAATPAPTKRATAPVAVPAVAAPVATAAPAAVAAPVAPPAAPTTSLVKSEFGDITITKQSGKKTVASLGGHSFADNDEDAAIEGLLNILEKQAKSGTNGAAAAVSVSAPTEAPAALVACTSFRQVIMWFLEQKITDPAVIVQHCTAYKETVPAIARLSGELPSRVSRALEVIKLETA